MRLRWICLGNINTRLGQADIRFNVFAPRTTVVTHNDYLQLDIFFTAVRIGQFAVAFQHLYASCPRQSRKPGRNFDQSIGIGATQEQAQLAFHSVVTFQTSHQ